MKVAGVLLFALLVGHIFGCGSPEEALELFQKGKKEYLKKNLNKAELLFKQTLEKDSRLLSAHIMLGKTYFYMKKYGEAEKAFARGIEKFPGNSAVHYWLARIYLLDSKKSSQAKSLLMKTILLNEYNFHAHHLLAKMYEREGKIKEALIEYNRAKLIKKGFDQIHRDLGQLYKQAGFPRRAEDEFKQISSGKKQKTGNEDKK